MAKGEIKKLCKGRIKETEAWVNISSKIWNKGKLK
jgi:hypothetical protein